MEKNGEEEGGGEVGAFESCEHGECSGPTGVCCSSAILLNDVLRRQQFNNFEAEERVESKWLMSLIKLP